MLPVVAIIGRPNVGKSTLFNRLTHTRNALISSFPGMTRDRQYGEVNLEQRHFIVIDTGGIVEGKDEIQQLISQQTEQAIQEADKVLFVIDAQESILPDDQRIMDLLRKTNKKIYVAVNKSENLNPETAIADAFALGIADPIAISAEHGQGISKLLHSLFPEATSRALELEEDATRPIKLAIVGRPNVGKSTLTNRMLGEERVLVHDMPGTTRDSVYVPLERHDQKYILIDTAGVRKRKKVSETPEKFSVVKTLQSVEDANVVLYVIDANLGVSDQDLKLLGFILDCGRGLVIAINKWDGLTQEARTHAKNTIDRSLEFVSFARIHFISALHGSGVGNLFMAINEAYQSATRKLSTPQLNRILEKALVTHQPPLVHGRRIKLRYAHAGGHNPQRIIIHGNQVDDLPQSYKKFLANYFQEQLKLYGTPVYIELLASKNPFDKKRR